MRYCPHCRKPTAKPQGDCPHCGKDLDTDPTSDFIGSSGGYEALVGEDVDEDAPLELDTGYTPPPTYGTPMPDEVELSGGPMTPPPGAATSFVPPPLLPMVDERDEEPVEFEPEQLEELAKYGPVPGNLIETVKYALTVRKRSAELKTEALRVAEGLEASRGAVLDEMARLGERARVAGYRTKALEPLLAAVEEADRDAESAADAVAAERRRHRQSMQEIEDKLDELRQRMEQPRLQERQLSGKQAKLKETRRQLELQIKRVEIEIRNGEAAIAAADNPPEDQDRTALEARADQVRVKLPEFQAKRQQLRSRTAQLDEPQAELEGKIEVVERQLKELRAERAALLDSREKEEARHQANTSGATDQSKQARELARNRLAEVGRALRLDRGAPGWAKELFSSLDSKVEAYQRVRREHQRFVQASEHYDQESVKRGYTVLAGGAGLLVIGLIALVSLLALLS